MSTYSIRTWDFERKTYTPQDGVPAIALTLADLRRAIRRLRNCGYTAHRRGNVHDGHGDNDSNVLIEREN